MLVFLQANCSTTVREIEHAIGLNYSSLRTIDDYLKANKIRSFNGPLKLLIFHIALKRVYH